MNLSADVAIVGSGISGMLVARECLRAGLEVVVLERGDLCEHPWQLAQRRYEADVEGARHNHETAPGAPIYPWDYLYTVGGASLHWSGHAPRLQPVDLRMSSAYGVMEDWPLSYEELEPYYERAEAALHVAGAPPPHHGRGGGQPHPLSPMDRLVAPLLDPYQPLPQARPSLPTGTRPPAAARPPATCAPSTAASRCSTGSATCSRHSARRRVTQTVAARVRLGPDGRAAKLEGIGPGREPVQVAARLFVLAASGFENPAILLRSGLDRPATGRYLYDHAHRSVWIRLRRPVGAGVGDTISTGHTAAFLDGDFRSRRSAAIAILFNPGIPVLGGVVAAGLAAGRPGADVRRGAADLWSRTLPFDLLLEDLPRPERQVVLSPRRDDLGLPLVQVRYDGPGPCAESGFAAVRDEARPAPRAAAASRPWRSGPAPAGERGLLELPCRMGSGRDAVVDPEPAPPRCRRPRGRRRRRDADVLSCASHADGRRARDPGG